MKFNRSRLKQIIKEELHWHNWLREAAADMALVDPGVSGETWVPEGDKALEMLAYKDKSPQDFLTGDVRTKYYANMEAIHKEDMRKPETEQRVTLKKLLMVRELLKVRHEAVEKILDDEMKAPQAKEAVKQAYIGTKEDGRLLDKELALAWIKKGGLFDQVDPDGDDTAAAEKSGGTDIEDLSLRELPRDKIEVALDQLRSKNISAESVDDLMAKIIDNIEKSAKEPTRSWILKNDIPVLEKIKDELVKVLQGDFSNLKAEGQKAAKTKGDPPYREQGSTESQAQQMAAGAAYGCRKKRGDERDACASKLKKRGGSVWDLYSGEITYKQLRNLAKLGQKVGKHKSKEPKHRKSLPGHVIPKKD